MVRVMVQDLEAGRRVNVTKAISSLAMNLALCMAFERDCAAKLGDETDNLVRKFHKVNPSHHSSSLRLKSTCGQGCNGNSSDV